MTAREIDINFGNAMSKANELDELAGQLSGVRGDLNESLQMLSANWQGESATQYIAKGMDLTEQIQSTARNLNNIADAIRSSAIRIRNAERRALELALQRENH